MKQLPAEIDHLENLERLSLDENQLSNISVLMRLKNLKMLGLSRNQITELPREVLDLGIAIWSKRGFSAYGKERDGIYLKANPLERPPMEIVKQGREAIRNYFESVEVESSKVYEAKLLVVGEGGVGKTCLMKRLMEPEKAIDEKELTTEGIGINRWFVDTKRAKNFRVNFWDFGGQEIYHATHQFFLTKRSLYLFVWTARTDDDMTSFDYWLNVVRLLSDNSPVIVVLNKTDERIKSIDEHSLQEKFGNIVWFDRVSAQEGTGIKGLINTIKERIAELPHIGDELPTVWVDIRKKLEGLDRHYISFEEYKGICWQFGLNEERAEHLSRYYHDLGVFLHFMDNAVLREIVFLKPDWATNAVYIVADTREVQEEHGRFEFGQLKKIWGDYPEDKYAHLLELMKKFELCFQIPRTQTYIVPELLRPSRPKFEWDYKDNLRFEYRYEFMPAGIITRFIVRTHDMVKDDIYWKNGVILQRENTEALVISERLNRKISIWIRGEKKKELLAIIRREIDYIHNTLNEPDVKEMIPCTCSGCAMAEEPHFYDYQTLCRFRRKGKIACEESTEDVSIENLLGDYEREKDKRKMEYRERGDTYIANQMSFGNKAQHVGRDIKTTTPEPKKKWQKSVIKLLIIFASIATILILLFGDDLYTRFKAKPKSDKPTVEQAMNESPGGVQIAGDVYVKKSESHIYRELSSNIKNEMTLLLKKLREQYNNVNVKISVTSEKGNQVRHRVAEEISAIIASARFDAKLAQPILRFSNDTSDVVIKYNENDTELVKDLSKVLNLLFKGTSFLAKKDTNLQRYELQIIIAGDPLFSSNGTVTFQ